MKKKKAGGEMCGLMPIKPERPKPNARIEFGDKFKVPHLDIDEEVTITLKGTVTAMRSDEWGRNMEMTVTAVKTKGPSRMTEDMEELRESRKMR